MENIYWEREKALKQLHLASILVIIGGVIGFLMSADDFVALGARTTSLVFPYFYNFMLICLSIFQIVLGVMLKGQKPWTRIAVFVLFAVRIGLGYFDYGEVLAVVMTLGYVVHVLRPKKAGWLFR